MKHLRILPIILAVSACTSKPSEPADAIAETVAQVSQDSLHSYVEDLVGFGTRHSMSSQTDENHGIGATVNYIKGKAARWAAESGRNDIRIEEMRFDVKADSIPYDRDFNAMNVLVTVPGTDGSKEILMVAQMDTRVNDITDSTSVAPGADDDGSGVACLLETYRLVCSKPMRQTVKFVFVSCEEQDLGGSAYAAKVAREEGWPVIAVISNDMLGNTLASGTGNVVKNVLRVFSESQEGDDSNNRQLARYFKEIGEKYVPDHEIKLIYRNDRYRRGGDQMSFLNEGFTAIRVCEYCENYDRTHQYVREENGVSYGDVIEAMDFEYLTRNTQANVATLLSLAEAPATPENAEIANARELSNVTVLSWTPVQDADHYEILFRETDQPQWQVLESTSDVCDTVKYSKDNYFYAVRSVSAEGNPSLPYVCR